jgi:hypothetical protein
VVEEANSNPGTGASPNLVLLPDGDIGISSFNTGDESILFTTNESGDWATETVSDADEIFQTTIDLDVDSDLVPHIVFVAGGDLYFGQRNSGTWDTKHAGNSHMVSYHNSSLALGPDGTAWCLFEIIGGLNLFRSPASLHPTSR